MLEARYPSNSITVSGAAAIITPKYVSVLIRRLGLTTCSTTAAIYLGLVAAKPAVALAMPSPASVLLLITILGSIPLDDSSLIARSSISTTANTILNATYVFKNLTTLA